MDTIATIIDLNNTLIENPLEEMVRAVLADALEEDGRPDDALRIRNNCNAILNPETLELTFRFIATADGPVIDTILRRKADEESADIASAVNEDSPTVFNVICDWIDWEEVFPVNEPRPTT